MMKKKIYKQLKLKYSMQPYLLLAQVIPGENTSKRVRPSGETLMEKKYKFITKIPT